MKKKDEKKTSKLKPFIKKHKILTTLISLVLVISLIGGGVLISKGNSKSQQYSFVRTTTLVKGTLEDTISATGTVKSAKTSNVTTSLNYTVKSVSVKVGDEVEKGDVICTLNTDELESQIEKEEENLSKTKASAQSSYNSAKTAYSNANTQYTNYKSTYNSAKSAYEAAKTPYDNAINSLKANQSAYDSALEAFNKAGAKYVSALAAYNSAVSSYKSGKISKSKLLSAAKAYMKAAQNYYGKCNAKSYDISDSEGSQSSSSSDDRQSASASSSGVTVTQSANAICNSVISQVRQLTGTSLTTPGGSNTLYKLAAKAQQLRSAKQICNFSTLEDAYNSAKSAYNEAKQNYSQLKSSVTQAKEQLEKAAQELENASSSDQLDELKQQLSQCSLKAAQSGTVTALNATVGSVCKDAVATIQNLSKLQVSITVEEADINNVKIGQTCRITSDASDETLSGTLTQINPVSSDGSFGATVTVDDSTDELHIGMNASVDIIVSSSADVYQVPVDAVGDDNGTKYVYRKTGGSGTDMTFEKVSVTTGDSNDYYIEISSTELAEGDIIRSSADLSEGVESADSDDEKSDKSGGLFASLFGSSNDDKREMHDGGPGNMQGGPRSDSNSSGSSDSQSMGAPPTDMGGNSNG